MVSTLMAYALAGIPIAAVSYILVYPKFRNKSRVWKNSSTSRKKPYLHDDKYGFCKIEGGKRLSGNSFQLILLDKDNNTHMPKYYDGDIIQDNEFDTLVGSGSPLFVTKSYLLKLNTSQIENHDQVQKLRNELEGAKADAKVFINNPKESVREIVELISVIEGQKYKKEAGSRG